MPPCDKHFTNFNPHNSPNRGPIFILTLPLSVASANLLHIKCDNIYIHKSEGKERVSFKYLKIKIKSCESIKIININFK